MIIFIARASLNIFSNKTIITVVLLKIMNMKRFASPLVIVMLGFSGCSTISNLIDNDKLPGERIDVSITRSQLVADDFLDEVSNFNISQHNINKDWNGGINQFNNTSSNLLFNDLERLSDDFAGIPYISSDHVVYLDSTGVVKKFDKNNLDDAIWANETFSKMVNKSFFDFSSVNFSGAVIKNNESIIATSGTHYIICINHSTGENIWSTKLSSPTRGVAKVKDDTLFIQTIDNKIYSLSMLDGSINWVYIGESNRISQHYMPELIISGPYVIAKLSNDEIVALNMKSGFEEWSNQLIDRKGLSSIIHEDVAAAQTMFTTDELIISSNNQGFLVAIEKSSGATKWVRNTHSNGAFWVSGDIIVDLNKFSQLVALDVKTGKIIWISSLKEEISDITAAKPFIANDKIYVLNTTNILELEIMGQLLKKKEAVPYNYPFIEGGTLYVESY